MGSKNFIPGQNVEVIGHRGNVSLYPENTIEGFLSLINIGADALELDLVISADKRVVTSHEPFMSAEYMLKPDGGRIEKSEEKNYLLYNMSYDSIKSFKIGTLRNSSKFPQQQSISAHKPLLDEIFSTMEKALKEKKAGAFNYYLEIKSAPAEYEISQPHPQEFVDLVMQIVKQHKLEKQVIIKSFDAQILFETQIRNSKMPVSYLLFKSPVEESLKHLNFKPDIVSPHYKLLTSSEKVTYLQQQNIKVIPWTVNAQQDILKMIKMGVDGLISNYPEKVIRTKSKLKN